MTRRRRLAVLIACAAAFASLSASPALAIGRDTVIMRAQSWVLDGVTYSQSQTDKYPDPQDPSKLYRRDCSGFVSMALGLYTSSGGYSTRTLPSVTTTITKDELKPGDILNSYDNHAVLFAGWTSPARLYYLAFEESFSRNGAVARLVAYPYWTATTYVPRRYPGIVDSGDDVSEWVEPVSGPSRYDTAYWASRTAFVDRSSPSTLTTSVVVASGSNFPDALGAASLAGALRAPVLLVSRTATTTPDRLKVEIRRLRASRAVIVGGESAITTGFARSLSSLVRVERVGGENRYETAALVASQTVAAARASGLATPPAFVARGDDFPDALAAGPLAYARRIPILLVARNSVPASTYEYLKSGAATGAVVLGGESVVSSDVARMLGVMLGEEDVRRISGPDRYATAIAVARHGVEELGLSWTHAGVATGAGFADALAGGPMQGRLGGVLLLTPPTGLDRRVDAELRANAAVVRRARVIGGKSVVSQWIRERIALALGRPEE